MIQLRGVELETRENRLSPFASATQQAIHLLSRRELGHTDAVADKILTNAVLHLRRSFYEYLIYEYLTGRSK